MKINIHWGSLCALAGDTWVLYISLPLFSVPPGASIRPMELAAVSILSDLLIGAVGIPLTLAQANRFSQVWKRIGIGLSLFPLLFFFLGWHLIAAVRGFTFAP